jgi:hypothetical protein
LEAAKWRAASEIRLEGREQRVFIGAVPPFLPKMADNLKTWNGSVFEGMCFAKNVSSRNSLISRENSQIACWPVARRELRISLI